MKILKRISKKAEMFLLNETAFTKADVKNGDVTLVVTPKGYSVVLNIVEVPSGKGKKKLFRGLVTPEDFIHAAIKELDGNTARSVIKRALLLALEAMDRDDKGK